MSCGVARSLALSATPPDASLAHQVAFLGDFRDCVAVFAALDTSGLTKQQAYTDAEGRPKALRSEFLKMDRKQVHFDLALNKNGCVLKISLKDQNGRTTLMVPSSGLKAFSEAFTALGE
jgi:hypothetical protein